ncbi:MAG: MBL fold metallo-hydrolase [Candidatus Poseidoniales archaeon]|nr:MAG: MBL fold metallo-hydrolase [Candidatus Poseidoniales archaeon]
MFDLHILGTSGSRPTGTRSVSGNYLSTSDGNLIIDCGEGFQSRLIKHELDLKNNPIGIRARFSKIKVILLTHSHLDHCWGILPLLKTMQLDGRQQPLTIIAPSTPQAIEWAEKNYRETIPDNYDINPSDFAFLFKEWRNHINNSRKKIFKINWILIPINGQNSHDIPLQPIKGIKLTAIPTKHTVVSVAWLISSIEKPDRSVLISGDTKYNGTSFKKEILEKPVDILIHEATFTDELSEKAGEHGHSTALEAGKTASDINAQILGMVHFSPRINDLETVEIESRIYHNRSFACNDGDIFRVSNNGEIKLFRKYKNSWYEYDTQRT